MDQQHMLEALHKVLPGAAADSLHDLITSAIEITTTPTLAVQIAIGASKLGGLPDLPANTPWPQWNGKPLAFVLQIRLADLPAVKDAQLPKNGMLSFFYEGGQSAFGDDPAERGACRVLWTDTQALSTLKPASALTGSPTPFTLCRLAFSAEASLPVQPALYKPALDWSDALQTPYEVWRIDQQHANKSPAHHLLGYADTIQDDMRPQVAALSHGLKPSDPQAADAAKSVKEWQLLLQVDSDEHLGMQWGSAGMIYFWITRQKLQQHDFSDVWVVLQSD